MSGNKQQQALIRRVLLDLEIGKFFMDEGNINNILDCYKNIMRYIWIEENFAKAFLMLNLNFFACCYV